MTLSSRLRTARTGVRVATGTALAVAAVAGTVALAGVAWPTFQAEPLRLEAVPVGTSAVAACPGPQLVVGRNAAAAGEIGVAAPATVAGAGAEAAFGPNGAAVFSGQGALGAVAAQSTTVAATDLIGFTAAVCAAPKFETWLVGGATTTGSADVIVLGNPSDVAASVDLTVFGAAGEAVLVPGAKDIVVAPRDQVMIPLSGIAPGERSPVVRVASARAPVAASLQVSLQQTLDPTGSDVLAGAGDPGTVQVIPGIAVPAQLAEGTAPLTVRVLAPTSDTVATVTTLPDGGDAPIVSTVPLQAGIPVDVAVTGMSEGRHVVRVEADVEIVAAATTASSAPRDLAWSVAAPELEGTVLFAVPDGPGAQLSIGAGRSDTEVEAQLTSPDGLVRTVAVSAGGTAVLPLGGVGVWKLAVSDPVAASVSYAGPGALGGFPVQPAADEADALVVRP